MTSRSNSKIINNYIVYSDNKNTAERIFWPYFSLSLGYVASYAPSLNTEISHSKSATLRLTFILGQALTADLLKKEGDWLKKVADWE